MRFAFVIKHGNGKNLSYLMIAMQHVDLISHTIPDVFYPSDIWMVN